MKIVHLPVYHDNPYQKLLMDALQELGHEVIAGGGGGNFLRTCLFRWRPDILHIHWTHPYMIKSNLIGTWLRSSRFILELGIIKMVGTKLVWTVHNLVSHDSRYPKLEMYFMKRLAIIVNKIIVHGISSKLAVTELLNIKNPEKISVIYHGNYIGYYQDDVTQAQARKKLDITDGSFVLLFIGQIHPYKGVIEFISAFKRVDHKNLILIIAGVIKSKNFNEELNASISDDPRIHLYPGYIEDNKLQYYLRAADLVVLPYIDILTSGSLILAMGFERCCLVPDIGVLAETVGSDGGFIYKTHEQDNLHATLYNILKNPSEIYNKGAAARTRVEYWSFNNVAKKTEQVYFSVM